MTGALRNDRQRSALTTPTGLATLLRRRGRVFTGALLLSVAVLAAGTALLGVAGWFISAAALAGVGAGFNFLGPSAVVRALALIRILARYGERLAGHDATLRLLSDLRVWVFRRAIPLAPARLGGFRNGDLVSRLTGDVEALDVVFLSALGPILAGIAVALLGVAALSWILEPAIWVLPATLLPAVLGVPLLLLAAGRAAGQAAAEATAELRIAALDAFEGRADLAAFGAEEEARARLSKAAAALAGARHRQAGLSGSGLAAVQLLGGAAMLATLWLGLRYLDTAAPGREVVTGALVAGAVLLVIGAFEVAGPAARGWARLGGSLAAAGRLQALAETPAPVTDPALPRRLPSDGVLELRDVTFGYDPARPILRRASLTLRPGERLAVLGASGCGKSTLAHLILRLQDVQGGAIRFGGCDLRDCAQAELHHRVALLSQDTPVFLGTVRDNLRVADPTADDGQLHAALGEARLDGFVASLPDGLDSWVGEGGSTLSAGQLRRLCLARTLLSPARLLVLDEPTAGLDPATATALLADLARAVRGRTVLLITHAALPPGAVDRACRLQAGGFEAVPVAKRG